MFSVHTTPEKFENVTITGYSAGLDLCLKKTRSGKSRDYRKVIVYEKLRLQNVFVKTKTQNRHFPISPL